MSRDWGLSGCLAGAALGGLGLVAVNDVELVPVARALPAGFGALVAGRPRLVALIPATGGLS